MEEFLPTEIKTTEDGHDCPVVSADYLKRHKVSLAKLDEYQIRVQSDNSNPGLSWPEYVEVVEDVAYRWNNVDGQLANYEHFLVACKRRALRAISKQKTETLVIKTKEDISKLIENEIDEKYNAPWNDR